MSLTFVMMFGSLAFAADKPATKVAPAAAKTGFAPKGLTPEMKAKMEQAKKDAKAKIEKAKQEAQAQRQERHKQEAELKTLVQQYQSAKPNSEEQTKAKEKINTILTDMRKKQLEGQEGELKDVKERLAQAEKELEIQKKDNVINSWAETSLQRLVQTNGNVQVLYAEPSILDKALAPYNKHQERLFMMQQAQMQGNKSGKAKK